MEFGYFTLLFGIMFSIIAIVIYRNKTYLPKSYCPTDLHDAKTTKLSMIVFGIAGPILTIISLLLIFMK